MATFGWIMLGVISVLLLAYAVVYRTLNSAFTSSAPVPPYVGICGILGFAGVVFIVANLAGGA